METSKDRKEIYVMPMLKTYDVKNRKIICQSISGTEEYEEGKWND